ncbi:MAG TPA: hypothetical protein VFG09_10920 [Thermodesulfovibrionales bacterium]|nr:hypothetical protein [Thermodesulfovibrionales bacterium]
MRKSEKEPISPEAQRRNVIEGKSFFDKYGAYMIIIGLVAYVLLLAIGTLAEIFNIQSILDWWIWRPPGKN